MAISTTKKITASLTKAEVRTALVNHLKTNNLIPSDPVQVTFVLNSSGFASSVDSAEAITITWDET